MTNKFEPTLKDGNRVLPAFLSGSGEMANRVRDFDWSKTQLGPFDEWPQSLCTT
ncbi:hypothetical protein BH23BAC1_BH23BAC1_46240 [soil metagenome]